MLLREVLSKPPLRLSLLTGDGELERPISRVYVTDLLDPRRYLSGGELVLTGLMWRREPGDSEAFVAACAAAGVAAIGAGDAAYGSVPSDLVEACRQHRLPLFEVPVEVSFREIIDEVNPSLWAQRATGLATELGRHRTLVAAMAAGARLVDLLPPAAAELGVDCWVLTPTARLVAGTAALPAADAEQLVAAYLSSGSLPDRLLPGGRRLAGVGVSGRPEHRLTAWLLACAADAGTPASALGHAAAELTAVVALERAHVEEAVRVERRLADQLGEAIAGRAKPDDLRMRLVSCGLPADATFVAVAAQLSGARVPPELGVAVVEELVRSAGPYAAVTGAVLPHAVLGVLAADPSQVGQMVDAIRAAVATLAPGLGGGQLAVGVSEPTRDAGGLTGAVEEARHALRTAAGRPDRALVVTAGDVASHVLLLAGVPEEIRQAFRERLLGPLERYDRDHDAELVHTLDSFLASSGSWSRCAETLHLHVNTLRYRISRIEQLTGRDLGRIEDRVDFFLALRLP